MAQERRYYVPSSVSIPLCNHHLLTLYTTFATVFPWTEIP